MSQYHAVFNALEGFIRQADPVLNSLESGPISPDLIRDLQQRATADEVVLRELTNFAGKAVYQEIEARNTTIQNQGSWIFALVSLQWLIFLAALIGSILYIRRQRAYNLELVNLTRLLRTASRKAEGANQAKSVFLANMSHELRTPFQGMLGMLNLLSDTSLSHVQKDYANTALLSARHLLGILNDILDISAIESGSLKLRTGPVHLRNLITEVQALMMASAHQKNIDLRVTVDEGLPQWIEADATRLNQILFNLLSNAIKFTDTGFVSMKLTVSPLSFPGARLGMRLTVSDSGIGMDATTLAGLFSRFHQADQSVHRRYGGSGLGLEISLTLAKLMGGYITAESTVGNGSVFTFELPLHLASAPETSVHKVLTAQRSLRILIAEDHPVNIKYLRILLEKMGHETISCENGIQVLECLQKYHVDVILMDLHMPLMDGLSATRAIRQLDSTAADVKIIMVSADILNDTRQTAIEAGVNDFIAKPVQADSLRQALDRAMYETQVHLDATGVPLQHDVVPFDVINARVYQEFSDLMPPETVKLQLEVLLGADQHALSLISEAWTAGKRLETGESAHRLKGVCMLMGLTAMANTLAKVEIAAQHAGVDAVTGLLLQFQADVNETRLALAAMSASS
jgi:signal transduction histidine kinase/CheY-like chemotaxis protein